MATNRADTLDPALLRPGRLDRKIEFPLPDRRQKRLVFQVCIVSSSCKALSYLPNGWTGVAWYAVYALPAQRRALLCLCQMCCATQ
jgi:hypothetical protein